MFVEDVAGVCRLQQVLLDAPAPRVWEAQGVTNSLDGLGPVDNEEEARGPL